MGILPGIAFGAQEESTQNVTIQLYHRIVRVSFNESIVGAQGPMDGFPGSTADGISCRRRQAALWTVGNNLL